MILDIIKRAWRARIIMQGSGYFSLYICVTLIYNDDDN